MRKKILWTLVCVFLLFAVGIGYAMFYVKDTKPVVITWWAFPVFASSNVAGGYEQSLIDAFQKENPNIKIELKLINFTSGPDKLNDALRKKGNCDVLFDAPGRIMAYGQQGRLVQLNDFFDDLYLEDVTNEHIIKACKNKEIFYMYPLSSSPFYMVFNQERAEKAGVAHLIKEGWTTEDFTKVLYALQKAGYIPGAIFFNGVGGDQATRAFIANLYNGDIIKSDLSIYTTDTKEFIEALAYVKVAVEQGKLLQGPYINGDMSIKKFINGEASFSLLWGPVQQKRNEGILKRNNIKTIEVPFPNPTGIPKLEYLVNGFCIFDTGDMARINAAKKFVKFVCDDAVWGPKSVQQTGCFPVRHSFGELYYDERMARIASWSKYYMTYYNTVDGFATMRNYWSKFLRVFFSGKQTIQADAVAFTKKINATISNSQEFEVE